MNRRKVLAVSGAVLAALLLVSVVSVTAVFAQEPDPEAEPKVPLMRHFGGRRPGGGLFGAPEGEPWARFDELAEALGLDPEELFAELHDGKTLEEIAEELGVDLEALKEQRAAEAEQAMRDRIAQAVEDGDVSQEQADWMLEGLDKGFLPRPGAPGFGRGGRGPMGRGIGRGGCTCPPSETEPATATGTAA
jgi:hypothetical protein